MSAGDLVVTRAPPAHDGLPRTQFGDIQFPAETHTVHGRYRHHVHEYPHSPGGAPEKLGRALYNVTVRGNFQATFQLYPDLYPNGMNKLRSYYELGVTLPFTHPTIGAFPAFIVGWTQVKDARLRSGEKVDIEFLEDQEKTAVADIVVSADDTAIGPTMSQLAAEARALKDKIGLKQTDMSLLDAMQTVVDELQAVKDTSKLYGNLYAAKLTQIVSIAQQLDASSAWQDARAWSGVDLLLQVWAQAQNIAKDLQSQRVELQEYVVPFTMPLVQIAINLYQDASRQSDLLSLNSDRIDNPMKVIANTRIRYYPDSPQDQIAAAAS